MAADHEETLHDVVEVFFFGDLRDAYSWVVTEFFHLLIQLIFFI